MISHITAEFRDCFDKLSIQTQEQARQAYRLFQQNPNHPSLRFKKLFGNIYSARVSLQYRTVGVMDGNEIIWFWIGPHAEYDKLVARLRG